MPHLGIPSLKMQDGGAGFHLKFSGGLGTMTCWPSLLALAATWDPALAREYAAALGEEFAGKGANGMLGPSLDVHRVARNGRNFEYLSGEDPYLGARLAEAYVQGLQSRGVFAVVKHWIFNSQETNRENSSSEVDERTAWELYYPPFEAAVDAGASAVMCAYNKVNGRYACENSQQLQDVLRRRMGFQGFVQSDWWATQSLSIKEGLDQEMPGEGTHVYFDDLDGISRKSPAAVDAAVARILAVIYRMRLGETNECTPPHCMEAMMRNVTSASHSELAARVATESIVMLRNEDAALPLKPRDQGGPGSILVVGDASVARPFDSEAAAQGEDAWAVGDYYSGGGSGHVVARRFVSPLDGIRSRAQQEGIRVISSPTNNVSEAVFASKLVDVIIVVVATTSGESKDRENLSLDGEADSLIEALSAVALHRKIIVLMQIPGAVLTPWRQSVHAILAMFLGGQETGLAWGTVLFGDGSPGGRLPVMMPATEADTIQPSLSSLVKYDEGLKTSYRRPSFKNAYPFGHGLSYSKFAYGPLRTRACGGGAESQALACLEARVSNVGASAARTTVQLYATFPKVAGYKTAILKGFAKTDLLQGGESQVVAFALTRRDLSYFEASVRNWQLVDEVIASIGESSEDLRQSVSVRSRPAGQSVSFRSQPTESSPSLADDADDGDGTASTPHPPVASQVAVMAGISVAAFSAFAAAIWAVHQRLLSHLSGATSSESQGERRGDDWLPVLSPRRSPRPLATSPRPLGTSPRPLATS